MLENQGFCLFLVGFMNSVRDLEGFFFFFSFLVLNWGCCVLFPLISTEKSREKMRTFFFFFFTDDFTSFFLFGIWVF